MSRTRLLLFLTLIPALLLAGCKKPTSQGRPDYPLPVKLATATAESIEDRISVVGSISANEMVDLKSETTGLIQTIGFEEGEPVKAGQLLVEINDEKLRAQVEEAKARLDLAQTVFTRRKELYESRAASREEFDEAQRTVETQQAILNLAARRLKDTRILAPFDGIAANRRISPGQYVEQETILTQIVDVTPVKVDLRVPERFLSALAVGQKIDVKVAAYPKETFPAEVYFLSPLVDETTRTILLRAIIPNEDLRLKPGMFANIDVVLKTTDNAVLIPEQAVTIIAEKPSVFVVKEGVAEVRNIRTGTRLPGRVEVVEGLQAGEVIVAEGIQKVRPGSKVTDATQGKPPAK